MTFILTLFDRLGNPLNEGDFVKISDGRRWTFFCEVKFLPDGYSIAPFSTFSFHSVEKIGSIPVDAKKAIVVSTNIGFYHQQKLTKVQRALISM